MHVAQLKRVRLHDRFPVLSACALALGLLASSGARAGQAGKRLVSPYQAAKARTPLTPGALLTANVTDKKNRVIARQFLTQQQYTDIRDGAMELVKRFPPSKYFYVPVGRSPTGIAAFLENIAADPADVATTVPASGLRNGQIAGHEAAWYEHLDHFLPKGVLTGQRHILLIDRSTTGATLQKTQQIFQQYLAARGSNVQVDIIAFSRRQVPIPYIDVNGKQELIEMNRDNYVPWAEWTKYEVGVTPKTALQRMPAYQTFKNALRERMARDAELHGQIEQMPE